MTARSIIKNSIEFFGSLVKDSGKKILLIRHMPGVHHRKPVEAWPAKNHHTPEVFDMPGYSPELNPEERLNADLKHVIRAQVPVPTKPKFQAAAADHMHTTGNSPEGVKANFQGAFVEYAA